MLDALTFGELTAAGFVSPSHVYQSHRVSYADQESRHVEHYGWFADDDQDEKVRGLVVRLPYGAGYVPGYTYCNASCAALDLSDVHAEADEAALAADRLAQREAEQAQQDSRQFAAQCQAEDEAEEAREQYESMLLFA